MKASDLAVRQTQSGPRSNWLPPPRHRLIGQILVTMGYVTLSQVNDARRRQLFSEPEVRLPLGQILQHLGCVTPKQIEEALSLQRGDGQEFRF